MNDIAVGRLGGKLDMLLDAPDVAFTDLVMADRNLEALIVRRRLATADTNDDVTDVLATHFLGR